MNISEIKAKLGVTSIDLTRGSMPDPADATKQIPTVWLRNWDNDARVAIIMHEDVLAAIKANATNLIVKTEQKAAKEGGEAYVQHTICTATSIVATV